jgi:hypothetical protein
VIDRSVLLIVSIDTEEDNWNRNRRDVTRENISQLRRLAPFLARLGARPTYFTTYQVAREPSSADVLREVCDGGAGEIAAHLHPWNTPPLPEAFVPRNSMLKNLPAELQLAKLRYLTTALEEAFGETPRSFRAGRYGLGSDTVTALVRCGYQVDSSVTPCMSWEAFDDGPTFLGAPLQAYRLSPDRNVNHAVPDGDLMEIPLSCGFRRGPVTLWDSARRLVDAVPGRRLRAVGEAAMTKLFQRVVLSPELASAGEMLELSRCLLDQGLAHLHLSWHSPSLTPGLSPYAPAAADVERLYATVETYVEGLSRMTSIRWATVGEAALALTGAGAAC